MLSLWVVARWIRKFSIVVLLIEGSLSFFAHRNKLVHVLLIREVLVQVVLEMLYLVHESLNWVKLSDSFKRKSFIIKFPGVDFQFWILTLLLELVWNHNGILIMFFIKVSRKIIQFNIEVLLVDIERKIAIYWWNNIFSNHYSLDGRDKKWVFHF